MEYETKAIKNGLAKGDYTLYKEIGSTSCYANRENSLIVYPDMSIRKCSIALDDDINIVGFLDDNAQLIKNNNWNLWTMNKNSIHNKQECSSCSFNPQCLSSPCPLKFIQNNDIICPDSINELDHIANNIINYLENKF
jgi:radical SAM protein with 4Fe4S-binding SPASM domain